MKKYTRTVTRTRHVPVTIDGDERMVPDEYETEVLAPPRDWDRIVLVAIGTVTAVVGTVSIAWSTTSIGTLLTVAVPVATIAYLAAGVFDLAWMACNAAEWLARNDPRKAELPRKLGHVALALAMVAVFADGYLAGSWVVGTVGATVSLIAKGLWVLTVRQATRPISKLTLRWLDQAEDEAGAKLIMLARLKRIKEAEHRYAIGAAALAAQLPPLPATTSTPAPDTADTPVPCPAIKAGAAPVPTQPVSAVDPAALLAFGIQVNPDTLRALLNSEDAEDDTDEDPPPEPKLRTLSPPGQSVADTVRTAIAAGIRDSVGVRDHARAVHGPDVNTETVERTRRRLLKQKKAG